MKAAVGANHTQHGRSTFPHAGPEWMPLTPPAPTQQSRGNIPWRCFPITSIALSLSLTETPFQSRRYQQSLAGKVSHCPRVCSSPAPLAYRLILRAHHTHTHTYHTHAYTHTHWQSHWCTHSYETTLMHTGAHTCTRTHIGTHSCTHTHPPHTHTLAHTPTPPCISGTALGTWTQGGALPGITLELV